MAIKCKTGLNASASLVRVPGSVSLSIDLVSTAGSAQADLEFVIVDATNAISFANGQKYDHMPCTVKTSINTFTYPAVLICGLGHAYPVFTIAVNVYANRTLQCSPPPSTTIAIDGPPCAGAARPPSDRPASPQSLILGTPE